MRDVLTCLQHNQVSWKKQAPYNLKCRKAIGQLGTLGHAPATFFVSTETQHALFAQQLDL